MRDVRCERMDMDQNANQPAMNGPGLDEKELSKK
jgi:hypothetical protein